MFYINIIIIVFIAAFAILFSAFILSIVIVLGTEAVRFIRGGDINHDIVAVRTISKTRRTIEPTNDTDDTVDKVDDRGAEEDHEELERRKVLAFASKWGTRRRDRAYFRELARQQSWAHPRGGHRKGSPYHYDRNYNGHI